MIVFLTLLYVAVLALLVKLGIIKLTLLWKLSPILWMLLLLITLFIPMQWGAPSGRVNVYQYVIEITPNVTGEVIDVPVEGLKRVRQGDVLIQIDPEPYQATVDQLNATLEDTKQNVARLDNAVVMAQAVVAKTEQQIEIAKTQQAAAQSAFEAAQAAARQAETERQKAVRLLSDMDQQVAAAQREFNRIRSLVENGAESQSSLDRAEVQLTSLTAQQSATRLNVQATEDGVTAARAQADASQSEVQTTDLQLQQLVEAELPRIKAALRDAELAAGSMIGDVHTTVAAVQAQLRRAEFELRETTVRAPAEGWAVGVTLRPGQRITSMPIKGAMSFVDAAQTRLVVGIPQYAMRHIKPGDPAEVSLKLYPGQIFTGTVEKIAWVTPEGQLSPSGSVAAAPSSANANRPFGVVPTMDANDIVDVTRLPGGAVGTAPVYTDKVQATHLIRRVMMRMDAWINYVNPL